MFFAQYDVLYQQFVESVVESFAHTNEYAAVYNFMSVTPFDNKTKIRHQIISYVKELTRSYVAHFRTS